jgi:ubiquinone/menaquinone biosynthesis C-methylase UbiE
MTFEQKSYELHQSWYDELATEQNFIRFTRFLTQRDTLADEMAYRLFTPLLPICQARPGSTWLTIGDGKFGTDAKFLLLNGQDALASDLAEPLLKYAYEKKFIPGYTLENAEKLTFADNSFDYVLCKESYHHFPRPYIALYEMLRVARKGVVLIEPQDMALQMPLLLAFLNLGDVFFPNYVNQIYKNRYSFEEVGNFVYKVSRREVEKVVLGLGLRWAAFQSFYFSFHPGMHLVKAGSLCWLAIKHKLRMRAIGFAKCLGLLDYPMLSCIIFKEKPEKKMLQALKKSGYQVKQLPSNPYL